MITLTSKQLATVVDNVQDWEMSSDVTAEPRYSGRGMYDATCVGIVHETRATAIVFLALLAEDLGEQFLDLLEELGPGEEDSLGHSTVTYWRKLRIEDGDDG